MLQLPRIEWFFLAAITTLTAVLAAKLFWTGLFRTYRAFAAFLVFSVARVLLMGGVKFNAGQYMSFFMITESVQLFLYVLMTMEFYGLIFRQFPGIRKVSQYALAGSLVAATVVSFLTLSADLGDRARYTLSALDQFMVAERGVVSSMVLLILLMTAFLAYYPVPLPRNLVAHSAIFAVFFLSKSTLILYRNLTGASMDRVYSLAIMGVAGACLCTWFALLRRSGEEIAVVVGHMWDRSEEQRLIAQLKGVNSALARLSRE